MEGVPMAKVKLPAGPQELTAEWLTTALHETATVRNAAVTDFDYEIIGEGVGVLGQIARVHLQYDTPEADAPTSLVGKFPAAAQENRDLANLFLFYEREVRFYEEIAEEVELRTPARYYSCFDPKTCDYVLLMEDMHPARCGDQVAGCGSEEAATLIREMGRFHATWWDHPRLPSLDWIPMGDDPVNQGAEQAYNDCFGAFLQKFGDRMPPRALQIAERFKNKIIAIEHEFASAPLTIAHGDLRYDNLYFSGEGMAVADWQIIVRVRGPYDVAYFESEREPRRAEVQRDGHPAK